MATYSFKLDRYNVAYFCDHTRVQFCQKFQSGECFEVRFPKYTVIRSHHKDLLDLKGKIYIGHCRGHNTIILFY